MLKYLKKHYKLIKLIELYIIFIIFVFIGALFISRNLPNIKNSWVLATNLKPETFTELYFEDHLNLPKNITRWQTYNFAFTLHNMEYETKKYPFIVYILINDQKIILDQGTVTLKENEFLTIKEHFGPLANSRTKVVVELIENKQSIHFWMEAK